MSLLRVLIPSWRFFDKPGSVTGLQFQTSLDGQSWSPWLAPKPPPISRSFWHLFLNPWGNAWLAQTALIDRLCAEFFDLNAKSLGEMKSSLSYQLVENWVRMEMAQGDLQARYFHFKIEIQNPGDRSLTTLASSVHEI